MRIVHFKSAIKSIALIFLTSVFCFNALAEQASIKGKKTLVVYFSQPENINPTDVDGRTGASVIVKNDKTLGSTQYIASIIQKQTQGDLFRIETVTPYPLEHEPLIRFAEKEQQENVHPALKNKLNNLNDYDVVFIGYPIWWYKMPMALYSFFDQYDFNGKTIIPFTTHGGSHFSGSISEIKRLEPNANILSDGLAISRNDVADNDTEKDVIEWLNDLKNK
ncbi:flavodoxin [uncultured Tolumonas sp.]|uniref:flavodoxin n=1 Tax=uncultured Tolumonas sp. TaxID=263765 RepID=UPI00293118B8|nr:flavodoxin [uncultured Tolumonas sp.]